jgi:Ni,Fe-hydrogenase III large subunit/Ni,Fe-hydrogenase III component G
MNRSAKYIEQLELAWGDRIRVHPSFAPNELYVTLAPGALGSLEEMCAGIQKSFKAPFVTLIASDERQEAGFLFLNYVFSVTADDLFLIVRVPVDPRHMEVPSIGGTVEAASWFEREIKDWFGIIPFPNIHPLASHPDWPEDVLPMLKDFDARTVVPRVARRLEFPHVEGEGIFEIPVGPVHAGIIEPGHFRFSVAGEPIVNLDVQLFYTHKGTEKIAEGRTPAQCVGLAERVSGDTSFGHALAYCHAIERLAGITPPTRAIVIRTMLLELERIYNHIGDAGALLLDVGFSAGAATAFRLKEAMLRLNEVLTGSRLQRGMAAVGGIRREIEDTLQKRQAFRDTAVEVQEEFRRLIDLVEASSSVMDRLETTGRLSQKDAFRLGIVGMAGRASGIDRDLRRDHPHCAYPHLKFSVAHFQQGDVLARLNVRVHEVEQSFRILEQLVRQHEAEPFMVPGSYSIPAGRFALGYAEGWRGEIVHWVKTDRAGSIGRWKITDPSFRNWRALPAAVQNNIVPDFPVINKSFNLSYSGNDR